MRRCWPGGTMSADQAEKHAASSQRVESLPVQGQARWHVWSSPVLVPNLAKGILVAVFGGFFLVAFLRILYVTDAATSVLVSGVFMAALLALQLFYFNRPAAQQR